MFFFLSPNTEAQSNYLYHACGSDTSVYTPNSTFQSNLNLVLSSLSSNANRTNTNATLFYNATAGRTSPDAAYGLYLCRGDALAYVCRDCVTTATTQIVTRCPEEREGIIWYDECMLRYANRSFVSTMDESPRIFMWNAGSVPEPDRFQQMVGETIGGLANLASNDSPNDEWVRGFATGEATFARIQTLYGLVQCTPDLSVTDCNRCLRRAIAQLPSCCSGSRGARVLIPSCHIRYDWYPFYRNLAPPTPTSATTGGGGKRRNTLLITISTSVSAFLVVALLGLCISYRMRRKRIREEKKEYSQEVHLIDLARNRIVDEYSNEKSLGEKEMNSQDFPLIQLDLIHAATQQFSVENKIGEGGFGPVYKGTLGDGKKIAVKRLSRNSGQGLHEFKNEVTSISRLQHRNLVRLLGCCLEVNELLLVPIGYDRNFYKANTIANNFFSVVE